jgi:hypothetical protein
VKVIERQRRLQRRKEGRTCIGVPDKNAALELVDGRGNDFHLSGGVLVLGREGGEEGGGKREMSGGTDMEMERSNKNLPNRTHWLVH